MSLLSTLCLDLWNFQCFRAPQHYNSRSCRIFPLWDLIENSSHVHWKAWYLSEQIFLLFHSSARKWREMCCVAAKQTNNHHKQTNRKQPAKHTRKKSKLGMCLYSVGWVMILGADSVGSLTSFFFFSSLPLSSFVWREVMDAPSSIPWSSNLLPTYPYLPLFSPLPPPLSLCLFVLHVPFSKGNFMAHALKIPSESRVFDQADRRPAGISLANHNSLN